MLKACLKGNICRHQMFSQSFKLKWHRVLATNTLTSLIFLLTGKEKLLETASRKILLVNSPDIVNLESWTLWLLCIGAILFCHFFFQDCRLQYFVFLRCCPITCYSLSARASYQIPSNEPVRSFEPTNCLFSSNSCLGKKQLLR